MLLNFLVNFMVIFQTFFSLLLILLILLQKGDDGGIGQVFMRNQLIYNRSDNLMVRKLTVILAAFTMGGCLFLSLLCYKKNIGKEHITKQVMFKYYKSTKQEEKK